ncbi:MAG: HU family DNA-binding protein [Nitrospinota bacterium]
MVAKKPMTKNKIAEHLAAEAGTTKKMIVTILDELAALSYKEAKVGFTVPGIGKLIVVKRKARMGRNPQTGEAIKIPARKALKFRMAKAAKDSVLT